jgi:hypothetical protein
MRLDDLMDALADRLRRGQLAGLGDLAEAAEAALADAGGLGRDDIERLAGKARRNARLVQAALGGVKRARARLAPPEATGQSTYGANGRRLPLGSASAQPLTRL